jgi:hypothetical protein
MLGFFYFLFQQMKLGQAILQHKERPGEGEPRGTLLDRHRSWGYWMIGYGVLGLIGGIVGALSFLSTDPIQPFLQTYGHGFMGTLALATLVIILFLGRNIRFITKPKIQKRFQSFHANMGYLVALFGLCSLITGALVLVWGPGSAS